MKNGKETHEVTAVAAIQPTPAVEVRIMKTAPNDRVYKLKGTGPSLEPKGKQRQIVLACLRQEDRGWTIPEVLAYAKANNLYAIGGQEASVKWHLHQMSLLGMVEVVNPTYTIEIAKPVPTVAQPVAVKA
jgi:hypothetical protein